MGDFSREDLNRDIAELRKLVGELRREVARLKVSPNPVQYIPIYVERYQPFYYPWPTVPQPVWGWDPGVSSISFRSTNNNFNCTSANVPFTYTGSPNQLGPGVNV